MRLRFRSPGHWFVYWGGGNMFMFASDAQVRLVVYLKQSNLDRLDVRHAISPPFPFSISRSLESH